MSPHDKGSRQAARTVSQPREEVLRLQRNREGGERGRSRKEKEIMTKDSV